MAPRLERSEPPYLQVVRHIRGRIESGELKVGDKIPSARQISREWGIALATATKVLAALSSEGLAQGRPGVGSVVTKSAVVQSARQRVVSSRAGRIYPSDEHARIGSAELTEATEQVANALGLEPGAPVIRRQRLTYRNEEVVSASVSWFNGSIADAAPLLLRADRIPHGTPGYISETTGRTMVSGRDQHSADSASVEDAQQLGIDPGDPVLRKRNWVYDNEGDVLEYGESVSAAGRWSSYEYEITEE